MRLKLVRRTKIDLRYVMYFKVESKVNRIQDSALSNMNKIGNEREKYSHHNFMN